ncbi:hypothetical protein BBK82_38295 [Lentzea guizhouensis]|uniref:Uncharacterized protein n=1 Tax=Lentzea guizhouensis TaxID=1586287 RepID=A0A1B2HTB4_9PSEU|nr:hypothetical protein BBK82_38295 [Lentzea guizhouensis]
MVREHRQGQRQPSAPVDDPHRRRRLRRDTATDRTRKQLDADVMDKGSSVIRTAAAWTATLVSWLLLVTTTAHVSLPGSNGRTCSAECALSSTISTRRPLNNVRR